LLIVRTMMEHERSTPRPSTRHRTRSLLSCWSTLSIKELALAEYLKHFPVPFLEDVVRARCIPFIGAGFSRNAIVPPDAVLPDWDELGRKIAAALPEYQYTTALDAISAYSHEYSRAKLVEALAARGESPFGA
jgi:hypothetical protein